MTAASLLVPYPWQLKQWRYLHRCWQQRRLPHALLLYGPKGVGKSNLGQALAHTLLCDQVLIDGIEASSSWVPCGRCSGCHLNQAGTHPDLKIIAAQDTSDTIKIDQVRSLLPFLQQTAFRGEYRIVICNEINKMNVMAANALLKLLEEPPGSNTLFILVTDYLATVIPTIRSRCQQLAFGIPPKAQVAPWLQEQLRHKSATVSKKLSDQKYPEIDITALISAASGAPLIALQWLQNNIWKSRAEILQGLVAVKLKQRTIGQFMSCWRQWQQDSAELTIIMLIDWWLEWLLDILKLQLKTPYFVRHVDQLESLQTLLGRDDIPLKIWHQYNHLMVSKRHLATGIALNQEILLESLLATWQDVSDD